MAPSWLPWRKAARSAEVAKRYDGVDFSGIDPLDFAWSFGGNTYTGIPGYTGNKAETLESSFLGMVQGAYKRNGVVFACIRARLSVFSEGRFQFQRLRNGRPGDLFDDQSLALLEAPWPNGTTGDLLTRMLQDADLAGNSYWTVRNGNLRRMRPDWVSIIMGSQQDPDVGPDDLDAELVGYAYWPGGPFNKQSEPVFLLPGEVAHFAPTPDPIAHYRGMSWLSPIIREIESDTAATVHKLAFFNNGATLQTVVSFKDMKQEVFEAFMAKMEIKHKGAQNAYRTLFLGGGADVHVVGADLKQLDFKVTQGAGETRIAAAAGVHPVIVGLSEGLQGSSLNAGNFGQARRQFAEGTLSTLWRNAAASLQTLVPAPPGTQLVIDKRDIPFLREDAKDATEIQQTQASTIVSLSTGGFTRESAIAATVAQDMTLLVKDPNWVSVQLQASGGAPPAALPAAPVGGNGKTPAVTGPPKGRAAIAAQPWQPEAVRKFNPDELRGPDGKWVSGGAIVHVLGRMTEDAFFASHGEDWHNQYGTADVEAILFRNGDAALYHSTDSTHVDVLSNLTAGSARRLGAQVHWAAHQPMHPPAGHKQGLVESRPVDLGDRVAHVGYGYDHGVHFVRVGFDKQAGSGAYSFDLGDEAQPLADGLQQLAGDIDNKAYAG